MAKDKGSKNPFTKSLVLAALMVALALLGVLSDGSRVVQGQDFPYRTLSSHVSINIDPATKTVGIGDSFALNILIKSGTQQFDSADASLDFDPDFLQVVDDDPSKDGVQITRNTAFEFEGANEADNTNGTIAYAAGTFGTAKSGDFVLATIHFTATAAVDLTAIQWVNIEGMRPTKVNLVEDNVLGPMNDGSVTIITGPAIDLDPIQGPIGTQVGVTGVFWMDGLVDVKWDNTSTPTVLCNDADPDAEGGFTCSFSVPSGSAAGSHTVTAAYNDGTEPATDNFMVTTPDLILDPTSSNPGTSVAASGTGYAPGQSVTITFAGATVQTTTAGADGSFSTTFNVPFKTAGPYTVEAKQTLGTVTASDNVSFTVPAPLFEVFPTSGPPGLTVDAFGEDFAASTSVTITFDGATVVTIMADPTGVFDTTFTVPSKADGTYNVMAKQTSGAVTISGTDSFSVVNPVLTLSPTKGPTGSGVAATGVKFYPSTAVSIKFDGVEVAMTTTDSDGDFGPTSFIVPSTAPNGARTVTASQFAGSVKDDATFTVVGPLLEVEPDKGSAGAIIGVNGSDFGANTEVSLTMDGTPLTTDPATITTDDLGEFSATFEVPALAAGDHIVTASQTLPGDTKQGSADFEIFAPILMLDPMEGPPDSEFSVHGTGFVPNTIVSFSSGGGGITIAALDDGAIDIDDVTADANGEFTTTGSVSSSATAGEHIVTASQIDGKVMGDAIFTVTVGISLSPDLFSVEIGVSESMNIKVSSGGQQLDGVEVQLTFDPSVVQVVDADIGTPGVQIAPGTAFDTPLTNSADNTTGTINFSRGASAGTAPSGTFTLATITFSGKAFGVSDVVFSDATTESASGGVALPVTTEGGTVFVPELILEPSRAAVGSGAEITVSGFHFVPEELVTFRFDGEMLPIVEGSVIASPDGSFVAHFELPDATADEYTVEARQLDGDVSGEAVLEVFGAAELEKADFDCNGDGDTADAGESDGCNEQSAFYSAALDAPLVVRVLDNFDVPMQGVTGRFKIVAFPGSGTTVTSDDATGQSLSTEAVVSEVEFETDVDGLAFADVILGNRGGTYTIAALVDLNGDGDANDDGESERFKATALVRPAVLLRAAEFDCNSDGDTADVNPEFGNEDLGCDSQTNTVNNLLGAPFVVEALDDLGNPVSNVEVTFTEDHPDGATGTDVNKTLAGPQSSVKRKTATNGQVRDLLRLGSAPGAYHVTATSTGLDPVVFNATAVDTVADVILLVTGDDQIDLEGTTLKPMVVKVIDTQGNLKSGVDVTFNVTVGNGTLEDSDEEGGSTTTAATDKTGQASATLTLGDAGAHTVTATCDCATTGLVEFSAEAEDFSADKIKIFSGDGKVGRINTPLSERFRVVVIDSKNRPKPDVDLTFTVTGGGGTLGDTVPVGDPGPAAEVTATTGENGQAASRLTLGPAAGANTVLVNCAACVTTKQVTFTATAVTDFSLSKVSGDLQYGINGTPLGSRMRVQVKNSGGSPIPEVELVFTPSGGTLSDTVGNVVSATPTEVRVRTGADGQAASRLTPGDVDTASVTVTCASCNSSADDVTFTATVLDVFTLSGKIQVVDIFGDVVDDQSGAVGANIKVSQSQYGLSFETTIGALTGGQAEFDVSMAVGKGVLSVFDNDLSTVPDRGDIKMGPTGEQSPSESRLVIRAEEPAVAIEGDVLDKTGAVLPGAYVTAIEADPDTGEAADGARFTFGIADGAGHYIIRTPQDTFWILKATSHSLGTAFLDLDADGIADVVDVGSTGATGQDIVFSDDTEVDGSVRVNGELVDGASVQAIAIPHDFNGDGDFADSGETPHAPGLVITDDGLFTVSLPLPPLGLDYAFIFNATVDGVGELAPRLIAVDSAGNCMDANGSIITCSTDFDVSTNDITVNFSTDAGWSEGLISASVNASMGFDFDGDGTIEASEEVPVNSPRNLVNLDHSVLVQQVTVVGQDNGATPPSTQQTYELNVSVGGFGQLLDTNVTVPPDQSVNVDVPVSFTKSGKVGQDLNDDGDVDDAGEAISGATVMLVSSTAEGGEDLTDADGSYSITLPGRRIRYGISVRAAGFAPYTASEIIRDDIEGQDFILTPVADDAATISGVVGGPPVDGSEPDVPLGVTVRVLATCTNDGDNFVTFSTFRGADPDLPPTGYILEVGSWDECEIDVTADGYALQNITIPAEAEVDDNTLTTNGGSVSNVNIAMRPVHTGKPESMQCADTGGCRVEGRGSRLVLNVPPGAAGATGNVITITVKETTDAPGTALYEPVLETDGVSLAIDFTVVDANGNTITQFSTPVSFVIEDDSFENVDDIVVGFFNETTGEWTALATCTTIDTDGDGKADAVSCTTTHLSKFSVLSSKVSAAPPSAAPTSGGGGGGGTLPTVPGPTGPTTGPAPLVPTTTGTINPTTGGKITAGNLTINVPAGVTSTGGPITLSVAPITLEATGVARVQQVQAPVPAGSTFGSVAFDFTAKDSQGVALSQFSTPVNMVLKYTAADLSKAGDASRLKLMRYDSATGQWTDLNATVDTAAQTLSANSSVTGLFALIIKLPAPQVISPVGAGLTSTLGPALRWTNPTGTRQYHIQVVPAKNDGPGIDLLIGDQTLVSQALYQIRAPKMGVGNYVMLPGMTYTWKVRTSSETTALGVGDPGWSDFVEGSFRTQLPVSSYISPVSPAAGSAVATLTPTVTWSNSFDFIFYYEVQLSKDPGFNNDPSTAVAPVFWELVHGGQSQPLNSYTVKGQFALDSGTTYYWRVRPRVQGDGPQEGVHWSDTWSFVTQ